MQLAASSRTELHSHASSARLHYVIESASDRRERTAQAIHLASVSLTDERGFDGWTMDQLAEEVGVSRRTLFNHVPGKMDAILGPEADPDPELVAAFRAGGPTGDLLADVRDLVLSLVETKPSDRATLARVRRVLRSDPRITHAAQTRFEHGTARFADLIRQREGDDFPASRARLLLRVLVTVFEIALDDYLDDHTGALADHFTAQLDDLVALLD
jgi:AcrR family transcriptional regulator